MKFLAALLVLQLFGLGAYANSAVDQLKSDLAPFKEQREAGAITYNDLLDFKNSNNIQTVDEFLEKYPRTHNFYAVGMGRSRSLQNASGEYPRILMATSSSDLVFSFNGHPSQAGYESIEVIQFNWDNLEFEMFRLEFPGDFNERLDWLKSEISKLEKNGIRTPHEEALRSQYYAALSQLDEVQLAAKEGALNPPVCMGCHKGSVEASAGVFRDPQPNWNPYPVWPDALIMGHISNNSRHPENGELIDESKAFAYENTDLRYQTKNRYRRLSETQLKQLHVTEEDGHGLPRSILAFSEGIYFLNLIRVFRITSEADNFNSLRVQMTQAAANCTEITQSLEKDMNLKEIIDAHKAFVSEDNLERHLGSLRALLVANGFNPQILSLNFITGAGNRFSMPGFPVRSFAWVFMRDLADQYPTEISSTGRYPHLDYVVPHMHFTRYVWEGCIDLYNFRTR